MAHVSIMPVGLLASMTDRLMRSERNDFDDISKGMLMAHEKRLELEKSSAVGKAARDEDTGMRLRITCAQGVRCTERPPNT